MGLLHKDASEEGVRTFLSIPVNQRLMCINYKAQVERKPMKDIEGHCPSHQI